MKDRKTRDRKARRNSWADVYIETTALRKHKMLLGQEVETDEWLEWRVKWGQRGAGVSGFLGLIFGLQNKILLLLYFALFLVLICILYYKNASFVIAKRLLQETNVVIILVLGSCNWSIDIVRPKTSFSAILGSFICYVYPLLYLWVP